MSNRKMKDKLWMNKLKYTLLKLYVILFLLWLKIYSQAFNQT